MDVHRPHRCPGSPIDAQAQRGHLWASMGTRPIGGQVPHRWPTATGGPLRIRVAPFGGGDTTTHERRSDGESVQAYGQGLQRAAAGRLAGIGCPRASPGRTLESAVRNLSGRAGCEAFMGASRSTSRSWTTRWRTSCEDPRRAAGHRQQEAALRPPDDRGHPPAPSGPSGRTTRSAGGLRGGRRVEPFDRSMATAPAGRRHPWQSLASRGAGGSER